VALRYDPGVHRSGGPLSGRFALLLLLAGCARNNSGSSDGTADEGDACTADPVCTDGLRCAADGTCQVAGAPGTWRTGAACPGSDWCGYGLECNHDETCVPQGDPGTADHGQECADDSACQAGLDCVAGACAGFEVPVWPGVACDDPAPDAEPFVALWRVPRGQPEERYYDLPFPTDLRTRTGRLDLTGYAEPGPLLEPMGDPVRQLLDLASGASGFATSSTVVFRLTHTPDWDTTTASDGGTLAVVDLTPGATYGEFHPIAMTGSPTRRQYLCENWVALSPIAGRPFLPGHTYAAYLTRAVHRASDGTPLQPDADLTTALGATPPSEPTVQAAWEAMAPLRDWIAVGGIAAEGLSSATVFTVHDPLATLTDLVDAVHDAPMPSPTELHVCDGTQGPYDDGAGRGCGPTSPAYTQLQGRLSIPRFQAGTSPYRGADADGWVDLRPVLDGMDDVPFVLTVPAGEMPDSGWPLALVAHGVDDDSRRIVRDGLAERWSAVEVDARTQVQFAVLSLDGVVRGERAGPVDPAWTHIEPRATAPERLFLNRTNPRAFTGNAVQAVADLAAAGRWAASQVWSGAESPTGRTLRFDADHIVAVGHGTGAWSVVPWTIADPLPGAVVLSATTGALPTTIAESSHPFDLGRITRVAWADVEVDRDQVLLTLEATLFDAVDPMTWYRSLRQDAPVAPRHVLQVLGRGGQVNEALQDAAARQLGARQHSNGHAPVDGLPEASGDIARDLTGITAGVVVSAGGDDALFADPTIARQVDAFLGTFVAEETPVVPQ
jgi:hypothetical protein